MQWTSSGVYGQGGFYALTGGDTCGGLGARSGRIYMQCSASLALTVYEPKTCYYNMVRVPRPPRGCVHAIDACVR